MSTQENNGQQLHNACIDRNFPSVRSLVSSGASVDYKDEDGFTPAISCSYRGHSEILQFILEHGANAELTDRDGNTPLIYAAAYNQYECVAVLVRHGVVLDAIDIDGCTALYWASRYGYLPMFSSSCRAGRTSR